MDLRLPATAALLMFTTPALSADLHWGDFKDNGCVSQTAAPGLRSYSSVLWNIPVGASWEDACASAHVELGGINFPHPAACINTAASDPAFEASIAGALASACTVAGIASIALGGGNGGATAIKECWQAFGEVVGIAEIEHAKPMLATMTQGTISPWPYPQGGTPLHGAIPDTSGWQSTLADTVISRGTKQVKVGSGGLNIWGVFLVPDKSCTPPDYHTLSNANWNDASAMCSDMGMKLCTRDQLCDGGQPVMGSPSGDVWAATGEGANTWVSVGTAYPDRMCKTHTEVIGSRPGWGTQTGPQVHTGQQTAFRCCP